MFLSLISFPIRCLGGVLGLPLSPYSALGRRDLCGVVPVHEMSGDRVDIPICKVTTINKAANDVMKISLSE